MTVLALAEGGYREYGVFRPGERADSWSLPGFSVDVRAAFAAAGGAPAPR